MKQWQAMFGLIFFIILAWFTGFKWAYTPMEFIGYQGCFFIAFALLTAVFRHLKWHLVSLTSLFILSLITYEFYQELNKQNNVLTSWEYIRIYAAFCLYILVLLYHIVKKQN